MIRLSEPAYKRINTILPQKLKNTLTRYSIDAQQITEISDWKKVLRSYFINVVIFSVVIITLIVLSTRYIAPLFSDFEGYKIITTIATLIVLSPFLWALAFRRTQRQAYANVWMKTERRGPLILLQLSRTVLAVLYIGILFQSLFSPGVAFSGIFVSIIILALFSKKIKTFYGRIETRFLANFHERESGTNSAGILTPWDSHITKFEISPQSSFVGKALQKLQIREKCGVNIVAIERGDFVINVPGRENHLYPNDKISVLGTDEQLDHFKNIS